MRALDADRVEVRLAEVMRGRQVTLEILAEDGRTTLARSSAVTVRPLMALRFDGTRVGP